jgi:hypothetical protein
MALKGPAMPAPRPDASRENFIARQLNGLRDLGLGDALLAREEALLRGGLAAGKILARLLDLPG